MRGPQDVGTSRIKETESSPNAPLGSTAPSEKARSLLSLKEAAESGKKRLFGVTSQPVLKS